MTLMSDICCICAPVNTNLSLITRGFCPYVLFAGLTLTKRPGDVTKGWTDYSWRYLLPPWIRLVFIILEDSFADTLVYTHLPTNLDTFLILYIQSSSFLTCDNLTRSGSPILEAASHYEKRKENKIITNIIV